MMLPEKLLSTSGYCSSVSVLFSNQQKHKGTKAKEQRAKLPSPLVCGHICISVFFKSPGHAKTRVDERTIGEVPEAGGGTQEPRSKAPGTAAKNVRSATPIVLF
ncbi:MAG: hypothetical protein COB04_17990 [Gammaproteobacteria bacterium]|nr:MAG: hypothetical protein COB04_17990 [Gammaproteobacteria bacterium]